jgi:hypothetical protein
MIQWLLTGAIAIVMLFAIREWRISRVVGFGLLAVCAVGIVFVWNPRMADDVARAVGVGRGADLVLYMYCAISFLLILNLSLKLRAQHEMMTRLARHIAIEGAREPGRDG